ncbi:MAG TPA: FlgD immunoglobulin-like domain containing protein [Candidatus Limnocylindrales bacterium]|nr:FlgD immunoglobulin-like domain containing protein [Candidatus Limnocylindrales bacterium]
MRNLAAAIVIALITALGIAGPVAAVQTSTAKVVIIVGATHGATAGYRSNADAAYNEAIKYTSHVTKVYSPNATWSKVKAAVYNANIVIYFGHGNGWPSPYTYDPTYTTKDGMGLNADLNGDGKLSDYENKYYGEPYMAQLHLAPNAIVLLHNLCYASGNSEPGGAAPSVGVARQRIDNYAAGFLKGGARAVIADGHMGPPNYLAGLFTTSRSIVDLWRSMPNYHGHESSFASTRSPGYMDYSDPDNATSSFYRSLVVKPAMTTTAVTNAVGDTGLDPASLVVPGRASVEAPAAPLFATATAIATTDAPSLLSLPAGTRLKTLATAIPAAGGSPAVIQVVGLDDAGIAGYVSAADLAPRDSRAPVLIGIDSGAGRFSPNDDGRSDEQTMTGIFSEIVDWTVDVKDADGTVLDTTTGHGRTFSVPWDGLVDGIAVRDGSYAWTARGIDAWQNGTARGSGTVVVDTVGVDVSAISPDGSSVGVFSPNGDGVADTVSTTVSVPEAGSIVGWVTDGDGTTVRSWTATSIAGANPMIWDGRAANRAYVPDGDYTLHVTARDRTGTNGAGRTRDVRVIGFLSAVRSSVRAFYPQDADRLATTTALSFALAAPATVTWTIRDAANNIVVTHLQDAAVAAGTQTWTWDGRTAAGALLPLGAYSSSVTASDGTRTISQTAKFDMNAFAIATSTSTPHRGSKMTVVVTSAEPLSSGVIMYVAQTGISTWHVTLTKIDSRTYKATITLKTGGSAGTVRLTVRGRDLDGRTQSSIRTLALS